MNADTQKPKGSIRSRHLGFGRCQVKTHGTNGLVGYPAGESRILLNCVRLLLISAFVPVEWQYPDIIGKLPTVYSCLVAYFPSLKRKM